MAHLTPDYLAALDAYEDELGRELNSLYLEAPAGSEYEIRAEELRDALRDGALSLAEIEEARQELEQELWIERDHARRVRDAEGRAH